MRMDNGCMTLKLSKDMLYSSFPSHILRIISLLSTTISRVFFPVIDADSLSFLQGLIDDVEIKNTIFSMKPLKSPGIDGLHTIFYQSK